MFSNAAATCENSKLQISGGLTSLKTAKIKFFHIDIFF